jgi:uncharacterized protein
MNNHFDVARLLLDRGANVDFRDDFGWTALIEASCGSHVDVIQLLLDRGANVDHQDKNVTSAMKSF